MLTPPDERHLLARVASGDQDALEQLYVAYGARLWRYPLQQLDGNSGWAEELLQDVFVAVWRAAGGYRGEGGVSTWLFRIAHRLAANARRARARRPEGYLVALPTALDGEPTDDPACPGATCEEQVLGRLALGEALGRLSARHREVLELVFSQGFSCEEASHILGVPPGTVKSRLSYARRALSAQLAAAGSPPGGRV
jgi:RNA polymerase sigma-70 factor (ECF subfamily)